MLLQRRGRMKIFLVIVTASFLWFVVAVQADETVPWNQAICPNGVEDNLGKLASLNPYDTKGMCFWYGGRLVQLWDRSSGLFSVLSSSAPFAFIDFGKKSAPGNFYSGVVLSKGAYSYQMATGAQNTVFYFVNVARSKEREEWDTQRAAARKVLEAKEAAARRAREEARHELETRQAAAREELETNQTAERRALKKAWEELDFHQAAEWKQLRARQATVRKEFWAGVSPWRWLWVGERELKTEVDGRERVEDTELEARQFAARQALAEANGPAWKEGGGYDHLSSSLASERYDALYRQQADVRKKLESGQEAERRALEDARQ
jgi:hypothetical protein